MKQQQPIIQYKANSTVVGNYYYYVYFNYTIITIVNINIGDHGNQLY